MNQRRKTVRETVRKKIALVTILSALLITLIGCGTSKNKVENDTSEKITVNYKNEIKKLDADCIVTKNPNCGKWLEKDGYQYYTMVGEYYIWCVQ